MQFDLQHLTSTDWQGLAAAIYILIALTLAIVKLFARRVGGLSLYQWRDVFLWPVYAVIRLIGLLFF